MSSNSVTSVVHDSLFFQILVDGSEEEASELASSPSHSELSDGRTGAARKCMPLGVGK